MRVGERPLDPSLQVELSTGRRFKHDPCVSSVFIGRRRPYHTLSRLEQEDLLRLSVGLFLENTNNKKRRKPIVSRVRELVRVEVKRVIDAEGTVNVAKTLDVSQPYVSKLKNQGNGLSLEFIDKLVDKLGYTVEFRLWREAECRSVVVDAAEIEATARSILALAEAGELTAAELRLKIDALKNATRQLELHIQA